MTESEAQTAHDAGIRLCIGITSAVDTNDISIMSSLHILIPAI